MVVKNSDEHKDTHSEAVKLCIWMFSYQLSKSLLEALYLQALILAKCGSYVNIKIILSDRYFFSLHFKVSFLYEFDTNWLFYPILESDLCIMQTLRESSIIIGGIELSTKSNLSTTKSSEYQNSNRLLMNLKIVFKSYCVLRICTRSWRNQ